MTKAGSDVGLMYKALDLHVHTPASKGDYKDKDASAEQIVDAAIQAGLDGICITDHNSAEWVDAVTKAAKGKPLVVFPGVEISVTGGKEGPVHIIGIFEPGRTSEEINDILSPIGLTKAERGRTDVLADGGPNDIIDQISAHGGIPALAHVDASHGVLHDMKGQPRIKVIQNPRLLAAEASTDKYRRFLAGTDPDYRRFLPTYESSDAHSPSEIGSKRTYFKVRKLSLESLRQCFYDSEVRILREDQFEECQAIRAPRIVRVAIDQGFLADQEFIFHPCHNTLIGGQGVGKSLLVEFIRFALDQMSSIPEVSEDSWRKLEKRLGIGERVVIEIELPNGVQYKVTRTYDGVENPYEVVNLGTGEIYEGEIVPLFPIMAYSQTEAVHIARNPRAQLELIDRFIDTPVFRNTINGILDKLRKNDQDLAELIDSQDRLDAVEIDIATLEENIANVEISLKSAVLEEMKLADQEKDAFSGELAYHGQLISKVSEWRQSLISSSPPAVLAQEIEKNTKLISANQLSQSSLAYLLSDLKALKRKIKKNKKAAKKLHREWLPDYEAVSSRYEEFIRKAGGDQRRLEGRRRKLLHRKRSLEDEQTKLQEKSARLQAADKIRTVLLDQLDEATAAFFQSRGEKYAKLTELSHGKLLLTISRAADRESFASALKNIATGTRIRKTDLSQIANRLEPREFVELVLEKDANSIASKAEIDLGMAKKLIEWLTTLEAQEVVLALQHQYLPQDVPSIQFKKDDGQYYAISDVSVGQRCTSLLIIALSAGDYPIIIDQPEESIDIASVFSDIVSKLRSGKDHRQYILTTHNPNIAVTADSDLIHILKSSATKGQIANRGVMEDDDVRAEVIQHVEGGEKPYLLRGKKYGLLKPEQSS